MDCLLCQRELFIICGKIFKVFKLKIFKVIYGVFFYPPEISHIVTGGYFVCCGTDVTPLAYYGKCCDSIIAILQAFIISWQPLC